MGKKTSEKVDDNLEFKVGDRAKVNMHRGRIVEAGVKVVIDRAPRQTDWKYTDTIRREFQAKHKEFIEKFNATGAGFRFSSSD
jgi:hypothetical protein